MKKTLMLTAVLGAGLLSFGSASAGSVTYSGNTATDADGTFARPGGVCDPCAYDAQEFTVDLDGLYDFDALYTDGMDGYIFVYEGSFDPGAPGDFIAGDDDGPTGADSSQILGLSLTAGTSYFLVTTAFDDVPTSFGNPTGAFTNTISGDGNITLGGAPVPVPAALWLLGSALIGLGAARRRKA